MIPADWLKERGIRGWGRMQTVFLCKFTLLTDGGLVDVVVNRGDFLCAANREEFLKGKIEEAL